MANDVTEIVTTSDVAADDNRCYSFEEYDVIECFLLSNPHIPMFKFIPPVIIVLGTFGNVMTIVMMRRMSEGQSSHTMSLYFTALAVSDLVILYVGLFREWLFYYFDVSLTTFPIYFCKLQPFLIYSSGTISAWLIVAMTIQRVMSVVWPHYKSLSYTKTKVGLVIVSIVALTLAYNTYMLSSYEVFTEPNSTETFCVVNEEIKSFNFLVYPWIDLALSSIIPFSLLIVGNSVLVWKVIQSVHVARVMTAGGCDQVNSRQKKASSLTLTLITVSLVFLLLSLPMCVYLIIAPYITDSETITRTSSSKFAYAVCDLAWYTNSAINFYLYCLTGSRFRNEVKSVFCGRSLALKMSIIATLHSGRTGFSKVDSKHNQESGDF